MMVWGVSIPGQAGMRFAYSSLQILSGLNLLQPFPFHFASDRASICDAQKWKFNTDGFPFYFARYRASKTAGGDDVVEVAEVVTDAGEIEDAAKTTQGNAEAVWSAEAAELSATFDMRFQVAEDAGDATFL